MTLRLETTHPRIVKTSIFFKTIVHPIQGPSATQGGVKEAIV